MTIGPGWYPDPTAEHRERWWDGTTWSVHVRTGRWVGEAACEPTPIPEVEGVVWADQRHQLTTHAAWLPDGRRQLAVPWWSVADIDVRIGAGRALAGTGDVVLIVNYPGYTDRRERRMNGVLDPDHVGALAFSWSRRHRKAAGYI